METSGNSLKAPATIEVLLIRAKNVAPGGGLRLDRNCAYIPCGGEMFCEQSVVRPSEIMFVRVGAGCYGRTAVMPQGLAAQADDWIHVLTPLAQVDGTGLVEWFNSETGRTEVRRLAKGVGTLSVVKSHLAELRIPATLVKSNVRVLESVPILLKARRSRRELRAQINWKVRADDLMGLGKTCPHTIPGKSLRALVFARHISKKIDRGANTGCAVESWSQFWG